MTPRTARGSLRSPRRGLLYSRGLAFRPGANTPSSSCLFGRMMDAIAFSSGNYSGPLRRTQRERRYKSGVTYSMGYDNGNTVTFLFDGGSEDPKKFVCFCGKRYAKKEGLRLHGHIHAEGRLICRFCRSRFQDQTTLDAHLSLHLGELFSLHFWAKMGDKTNTQTQPLCQPTPASRSLQ